MPRAVVFDFDGVLANSEPLHFRAFCDVLAGKSITLTEAAYYDRYLGYDDADALDAVAADNGRRWTPGERAALIERKARRLDELERGHSVLFPGAAAAVSRLAAACPLAIASGALRVEILRVLEREQLSRFFAAIVAAEDSPAGKPAPDPYLRAVDRLAAATGASIAPADCVAIEDSRWGLQSARAAGLRTVGITHTYSADALPGAELVLSHLDELTWEVLHRLDGMSDSHRQPSDS